MYENNRVPPWGTLTNNHVSGNKVDPWTFSIDLIQLCQDMVHCQY